MKSFLFYFFFYLSLPESFSQAPSILWSKCYGGMGIEGGVSITSSNDGGLAMISGTYNESGQVTGYHPGICGGWACSDAWVIKTDSSGNLQWQKCLGGSGDDKLGDIAQTSDGGFILTGYTFSNDGDVSGNHGDADVWVVKLNISGILQWQKCFGGTMGDYSSSVSETTDHGFVIGGVTLSNDGDVSGNHNLPDTADIWVVKTDSAGNIQWQKCLGGSMDEGGFVLPTNDGGYFVYAHTYSHDGDITFNHGQNDYWVAKLDNAGALLWEHSYGGDAGEEIYSANSAVQTSDNGFIINGITYSNNGDVSGNNGFTDYWTIKTDSLGILQWQKPLGGTNGEIGYAVIESMNGGYLVSGLSGSNDGEVTGNHGFQDGWIVKLDSAGQIEWQKSIGGSGGQDIESLLETSNGEIVGLGFSYSLDGDLTGAGNHGGSDMWLVKLSSHPLNLDAALPLIVYPAADPLCDNSFVPVILIKNNARDTITALDINYQLDGGSLQTYLWSGNLFQDSAEQVSLPSVFALAGNHTLKIYVSNPNGGVDENPLNDTLVQNFTIDQNFAIIPVQEGFDNMNFPPAAWAFYDPYNLFYHLTTTGGFGNSDSCLRVRLFTAAGYEFADMTLQETDFMGLAAPVTLSFSQASAMKTGSSMQSLTIYISTDCATSWGQIYYKEDTALATVGFHVGTFTPQPNEWRTETVDLTAYIGEPHVQLVFEFAGQFTNNLYIDDINIQDATSGIPQAQPSISYFNCYLNSSNNLQLNFYANGNERTQVQLHDITGRVLLSQPLAVMAGFNNKQIQVGSITAGIYLVRFLTDGGAVTKKLVVQ